MAGYGTDEGLAAWLTANGYELPEAAPAPAILRQRASDYMDGLYEVRFMGVRTGGYGQERAWGRTGAVVYGVPVDPDAIPAAIENASYAAAYHEALNPDSLMVSASSASAVKREKVGPIETEYFEGAGDVTADATVRLSAVEGLLAPFLKPEGAALLGLWAVG